MRRPELAKELEYIKEQPGYQQPTRPFEVIMPLAPLNVEDYTHKELGRTIAPKTKDAIIEELGLLAEAGATGTLVGLRKTSGPDRFIEWMDWFAEEIMPATRDL